METNYCNGNVVNNPLDSITKIYYPGSGQDLKTLIQILEKFKNISEIFFCDYLEHISDDELTTITNWELLKKAELTSMYFNQENWSEFWYNHPNSFQFAEPNSKTSNLFILYNSKTKQTVRFYQLATEGVGTYRILIKNKLRPQLIFLADYGFGCNWDPNIWGDIVANDCKTSYLKRFARNTNYIMVDKISTNPWLNYSLINDVNIDRWDLYIKNHL